MFGLIVCKTSNELISEVFCESPLVSLLRLCLHLVLRRIFDYPDKWMALNTGVNGVSISPEVVANALN